MLVDILSRIVKKLQHFAWEDGPSHLYKDVRISGDSEYINLFCCDGHSGIWQRLKQDESPLLGDFCIDVFFLNRIFESMDKTISVDLKFKDNIFYISNNKINLKLSTMASDQIPIVSKGKDFESLNNEFLHELRSVIPGVNDDSPIIYNGNQLFYANPRSLIYIPTNKFEHDLSIEQKFATKIFVDHFTLVSRNEGLTYFKNDDCEIFIPSFNGKILKIDPIVNRVTNEYKINCKVNVKEVTDICNVVHKIFDFGKDLDPRIILRLNREEFSFNFYDNSFKILDYVFDHDASIAYAIPLNHLKMITKLSFTQGMDYITFKFASTNDFFACANNNLLFVGGLYRV